MGIVSPLSDVGATVVVLFTSCSMILNERELRIVEVCTGDTLILQTTYSRCTCATQYCSISRRFVPPSSRAMLPTKEVLPSILMEELLCSDTAPAGIGKACRQGFQLT